MTTDTDTLVNELVAVHNDPETCRTADEWREILTMPGDSPLVILNLLRFKDTVTVDGEHMSGHDAYDRYSQSVAPAFLRAGAKSLFAGDINLVFASDAFPEYDKAMVSRYPSPRALAGMWLDPEFIAAHEYRVAGVASSTVMVLSRP